MTKFGKSQTVARIEDTRFLRGQGRYIDDEAPSDALFGLVFRSPVAHARIVALDLEAARAAPGVHLVVAADDLEAAGVPLGMKAATVKNRDGSPAAAPVRPELARDRVRHVGEPVAFIVAESLNQARDAAELIGFDYETLPVHLDLEPGGEPLHPEAPLNRAFDWALGDEEATEAAFAGAARVVRLDVIDSRVIANSIEPRGAWARWEDGRLHLWFSGQGVWGVKDTMKQKFGLPDEAVHVVNPDVGGGFGMKAMDYPEYLLVAFAARALGRPVRWMAERTEAMLSDNAGRDLVSTAELALDENGRILGYRVHTRCNLGAYNAPFGQPIQTQLFSRVFTGVYEIPAALMRVEGIYTNTTPVDAYRGAGRPEAIFVLERAIEHAARELDMDPWQLRRINFIPADRFPYHTIQGETYDVGDFHRVLDSAEAMSERVGFPVRRQASEARGRLRGLGLCYYIESILGDPEEGAVVEYAEDGRINLLVGTQSNGQGHETVFTRFLADETGLPWERIRLIQGDSDRIAKGGGTGGSRSATVQTNAILAVIERMIEAFGPFIAELEGVEPGDVAFDREAFRVRGSNVVYTLLDAFEKARACGREDLLRHEARARLQARAFPNGAHVCEVEVDPETGSVTVEKYTVVDDFGTLLHPRLVEGQVHGGVAQGLGQALTERVTFDEHGQLLTATFMDYAMPRADNLPMIGFATEPVPSTTNALGMKGCGEAGTVGSIAAVANAVADALASRGVRHADIPFTPQRVWEYLQNAPTGTAD